MVLDALAPARKRVAGFFRRGNLVRNCGRCGKLYGNADVSCSQRDCWVRARRDRRTSLMASGLALLIALEVGLLMYWLFEARKVEAGLRSELRERDRRIEGMVRYQASYFQALSGNAQLRAELDSQRAAYHVLWGHFDSTFRSEPRVRYYFQVYERDGLETEEVGK